MSRRFLFRRRRRRLFGFGIREAAGAGDAFTSDCLGADGSPPHRDSRRATSARSLVTSRRSCGTSAIRSITLSSTSSFFPFNFANRLLISAVQKSLSVSEEDSSAS